MPSKQYISQKQRELSKIDEYISKRDAAGLLKYLSHGKNLAGSDSITSAGLSDSDDDVAPGPEVELHKQPTRHKKTELSGAGFILIYRTPGLHEKVVNFLKDYIQNQFKELELDDVKWDTLGKGIFGKSVPDGIKKLRELNKELSHEYETPDEDIDQLETAIEISELLTKKVQETKSRRGGDVQHFYEQLNQAINNNKDLSLQPDSSSKLKQD